MEEVTANGVSLQQARVILQIIICQLRTDTVALYSNISFQILWIYIKGSSGCYNNKKNHMDLLVSFLTDIRETNNCWFYLFFSSSIKSGYLWTYCNKIRQRDHWHYKNRLRRREGATPTSHFKSPLLCTMVFWSWIHCHKKTSRYDKLYHIKLIWTKTIWYSLAWRIDKIGFSELHCVLAALYQ